MTLVAGVDSSTQSCKVLVCDAETGRVVREGRASHPDATEVDPAEWWQALGEAFELARSGDAGGLDGVEAVGVGGQQHGMVVLDGSGAVIRPALLWNDTRSGSAAADLVGELGAEAWTAAVGVVPVASFTITKLRWLADHEPDNASRIAAICLPHDWLTWKLRGSSSLDDLTTDRSDASGTGYFDPVSNQYRRDLLARALRRESADDIVLPRVLGPGEPVGHVHLERWCDARRKSKRPSQRQPPERWLSERQRVDTTSPPQAGPLLSPGAGDNAAASLGLGLTPGQVQISLGTSGVVAAVSALPVDDPTGTFAGFADALGGFLPLACTINGARILTTAADLLGVPLSELDDLALSAQPGAGGLVQVPWFDGERTPNRPDGTASLHGMTRANLTRPNLARAAVESLLCLMGDALAGLAPLGVPVDRVTLLGGASRSRAVRELAPMVLGLDVDVPAPAEYVALGAARQAAWVLSGADAPPDWQAGEVETFTGEHRPEILQRYQQVVATL